MAYPGKPITIIAEQPINALPTSTWEIRDQEGTDWTEQSSIVARNGVAELTLRHKDWMKRLVKCQFEYHGAILSLHLDTKQRHSFVVD